MKHHRVWKKPYSFQDSHEEHCVWPSGVCPEFVMILEPLEDVGDILWVLMCKEEIINMIADGHLVAVHHLICNTRVIWIKFKTNRTEVSNKFAIK
jgi:hypothetical protein